MPFSQDPLKILEYLAKKAIADAQRAESEAARSAPDATADFYLHLLTKQFEQASGYIKLVIGVGYAGLFMAWANVRTQMGPAESGLFGAAFLLSLMGYVLYEVGAMVYLILPIEDIQKLGKAVGAGDLEGLKKLDADIKRRNEKRTAFMYRVWKPVFAVTLACGVFAGFVLVKVFVRMALAALQQK